MGEVPSVPVHTRNVIGAVRTIRINLWRNVRSTPASDNYYSRLLDVGRHSKRQITERKMQGFNMQLKSRLNQLSFSHESNKKDEKRKKAKQKNRSWAIKSVNGHKNPWDPSEKVRETLPSPPPFVEMHTRSSLAGSTTR